MIVLGLILIAVIWYLCVKEDKLETYYQKQLKICYKHNAYTRNKASELYRNLVYNDPDYQIYRDNQSRVLELELLSKEPAPNLCSTCGSRLNSNLTCSGCGISNPHSIGALVPKARKFQFQDPQTPIPWLPRRLRRFLWLQHSLK